MEFVHLASPTSGTLKKCVQHVQQDFFLLSFYLIIFLIQICIHITFFSTWSNILTYTTLSYQHYKCETKVSLHSWPGLYWKKVETENIPPLRFSDFQNNKMQVDFTGLLPPLGHADNILFPTSQCFLLFQLLFFRENITKILMMIRKRKPRKKPIKIACP